MLKGVATFETWDGPELDATEFCLHPGNFDTRKGIAVALRRQFKRVSAHLPSYLPVQEIAREIAFDDGVVDSFTCHVTKRSMPDDPAWRDAWRAYAACGKKLLFENHNQDWHETDGGMCSAEEFGPLVDAGHSICLDVGHILYASMFKVSEPAAWRDRAEKTFEEFLSLPIAQVHAHTVDTFMGVDHSLSGFDVGPWLRRIVARHPDVVVLVETGDPKYSTTDKVSALHRWLA